MGRITRIRHRPRCASRRKPPLRRPPDAGRIRRMERRSRVRQPGHHALDGGRREPGRTRSGGDRMSAGCSKMGAYDPLRLLCVAERNYPLCRRRDFRRLRVRFHSGLHRGDCAGILRRQCIHNKTESCQTVNKGIATTTCLQSSRTK
jgi:hypothetical protein